jgi:hypothetical protein
MSPDAVIAFTTSLKASAAAVPAARLPTEHANDLWGEAEDKLSDALRLMRLAVADDTPNPSAHELWLDSVRQNHDAARHA